MIEIIKTASAIIVSTGIVGVIIMGIIKFSADKIAEKLSKKYEYKLIEKLEAYKSELEKKNYISKARFDLEFSIYGEISEKLLIAAEACFWLFPAQIESIYEDKIQNEIYNKRYQDAQTAIYELQRILGMKSPFISEDLYEIFFDYKKMLSNQKTAFEYFGPFGILKNSNDPVHNKEMTEAYSRSAQILEKHKEIVKKMRVYFNSLEIL